MKAGELVEVKMEVRIPTDATEDEVDAWLRYRLGASGQLAHSPLSDHELEVWNDEFDWSPLGVIGRREEFDHRIGEDGAKYYRVRYHRERVGAA